MISVPSMSWEGSIGDFHVNTIHFTEIGSTQSYIHEICKEKLQSSGTIDASRVFVVSADHQSEGRGKGDRSWFSESSSDSIAMSFLFALPSCLIKKAAFVTQLLALSAVDSLSAFGIIESKVKWPNDILLAGKKIGGILAEMCPLSEDFQAIIIGIGMNIDISDESLEGGVGRGRVIAPGAVKQITGREVSCSKLRLALMEQFLSNLSDFLRDKSPEKYIARLNGKQAFVDSQILFRTSPSETIKGVYRGISSDGGIIIESCNGLLRTLYSGEILVEVCVSDENLFHEVLEIFGIFLRIFSRLISSSGAVVWLEDGAVNVEFPILKNKVEGVVKVCIDLPEFVWAGWSVGMRFSGLKIIFSILKIKRNLHLTQKSPNRFSYAWLITYLPIPRIALEAAELEVSWGSSPAKGRPWTARIRVDHSEFRMDRVTRKFSLQIKRCVSCISIEEEPEIRFLTVFSIDLSCPRSFADLEVKVSSITTLMDLESFFEVIPTVENILHVVPDDIHVNQAIVVDNKFIPKISVTVDQVGIEFRSEAAGTALMDISLISGDFDMKQRIALKAAGGCVISRTSLKFGLDEMVRLPPFSVIGNSSAIDINIPQALLRTSKDGLVYWIRALVVCGSKFSATKRPNRVETRNARTKIYHDFELCAIDPPDWNAIPKYVPQSIPFRVRINFQTSVEIRTDKHERVITEDALIDVDLNAQTLRFSANSIEVFGLSRRRCAFIRNFSGFVSLYSACRLRDSAGILESLGKAPREVTTRYARPSELGPEPVAIKLSDITVELAEELILLIGRQLFQASDNVRKWDIEIGFRAEPLYKPVTVRLSRVRFAPLELAPAVLDLQDFELAVGPTKDCLSFAFLGVKAWVPSTVTVPPILHVEEAATVSLRVKRSVPLLVVSQQSDHASQPGCWRDLDLGIPKVKAAVAPGLHATTRLIDTIMKTIKQTTARVISLPKGPIKNVKAISKGGKILIVRNNKVFFDRPVTMEDNYMRNGSVGESLGEVEFGSIAMESESFFKSVDLQIDYLRAEIANIFLCEIGRTSATCPDGDAYHVLLSETREINLLIKNNAMAIFGAYSALKECFIKAWFIDPRPKLNDVVTHLIDVQKHSTSPELAPVQIISDAAPLVSAKVSFKFVKAINVEWSVPGSPGRLSVTIPGGGDNLFGELVFHGFALTGDAVFRRLPELTDQVLIQWLRYPWTIGSEEAVGSASPKSPSVAKELQSWDLHSIMTMRISDYLASAGSDGCWEYASAKGIVDTPMYLQTLITLCQAEVRIGGRVAGIEKLELRAHCHNLPTRAARTTSATAAPKIKMSYWASLSQDSARARLLTLDIVPQVHFPILLTLLGSPADADAGSSSSLISALDSSLDDESTGSSSGGSFLDKALSQIDLGFRVTMDGLTGRAGGWSFTASRVTVFKEEDKGKGLIVAEIRGAQIAMETALSLKEAIQPLHSKVCFSVPFWMPQKPVEVLQFMSVRQMMVHIGLHSSTDSPPEKSAPTVVFCNIQGARLWWSPSLSRGMRESLNRSDQLVETLSRWKARFTRELASRLGKSPRKKKTFESIMNLLDLFIRNGGSVKLVLRCADVQMNFHTILNGIDDLFLRSPPVNRSASPVRTLTPLDIPAHFLPFQSVDKGAVLSKNSDESTPESSPYRRQEARHFPKCNCCDGDQDNNYLQEAVKMFTKSDYLDIEFPKVLSWWTRAGHLQGCPLPPLPLPQFNAPPNSKKERIIGALKWNEWIDQCHHNEPLETPSTPTKTSTRPKPRGSQMLMNAGESIFEVVLTRTKGGTSNLGVLVHATLSSLQGSVAPTALRGLIWLGLSGGQAILRKIIHINQISFIVTADLFPLRTAKVRLLIPKVNLSTDDDAFHILIDVFRNAILYRGAVIDPAAHNEAAPTRFPGSPVTPKKPSRTHFPSTAAASVKFDGPIPSGKREGIIEGLLSSLAVADATLANSTDSLSLEYIVESVAVSLTHRQRCFVQLELDSVAGKHSFSLNHPHRPMHFSFQVGDISIVAADPGTGNDSNKTSSRKVLRSAAAGGLSISNILTVRGNDRYITLNNREWQVYDTLFLSISPIVVDITQELIEELYAFVFPPNSAGADASASNLITTTLVEEQVEVAGNRLLTGRNKSKAGKTSTGGAGGGGRVSIGKQQSSADLSLKKDASSAPSSSLGQLIFFKFVRFGNIDSIITFKGKQFSLNHLSLTLKYYLKRRRLATWKEFLDEWGAKVGKQAFGSFVKHGFTRKKGIQDIVVNKFSDVDKLLFGKHSN